MSLLTTTTAPAAAPERPGEVRSFPKTRVQAYDGCSFARTNTSVKICWWMPSWIAGTGSVKASELLAYAAVWRSKLWGKDACKTSAAEVAEITGMSKATAYRALSALVSRGLISEGPDGMCATSPSEVDLSCDGPSFDLPAWMAVQYSDLPSSALIVLCVYHNLASKGSWGFAKVGEAWICNATGIPERTVRRCVSTLAAAGLIVPHLDTAGHRCGWESGASCELSTCSAAAEAPRKILKMAAPTAENRRKVADSVCKMAPEPIGTTGEDQQDSPNKSFAGDSQVLAADGSEDKVSASADVPVRSKALPSHELEQLLRQVPRSKHPATALEVNDCNKQVRTLLDSGVALDEISDAWKSYSAGVRSRNAALGGGVRVGWEQYLTSFRSWLRFRAVGDIEAFRKKDARKRAASEAEEWRRREAAAFAERERRTADAVREFEASDPRVLGLQAQANAIFEQLAGRFSFDEGSKSYELTMRYCDLMQQSKNLVDQYRDNLCV